jgi:hypothetical protein
LRVCRLGLTVRGLGLGVKGLGFGVEGLRYSDHGIIASANSRAVPHTWLVIAGLRSGSGAVPCRRIEGQA